MQKICAQETGITGLYVGLFSDTSKTIADSFLFFLAYNFLRQSRIQSSRTARRHLTIADELGVGFLSGAFSKFFTTPIANVVTRMQTASMLPTRAPDKGSHQDSIRRIALQVYAEKGVQGFWSGYSASLVLTLNPSLTFLFFETLKRTLLPRKQRSNPSAQVIFFLAAISKALASTITYPFSLAKSRLQASAANNQDASSGKLNEVRRRRPSRNVFTTIIEIVQSEGFTALYEGLGGEVLKGFFSHGITMIVKEAVHKLVIQLYYTILKMLKRFPSPQETAIPAMKRAEKAIDGIGERTQQTAISLRDGIEYTTEAGRSLIEKTNKSSITKAEH